jgi:hypothetical protein
MKGRAVFVDADTVAGPGNYVITVRVTDNGSPPASATTTFTIVVVEHVRISNIAKTSPGEIVLTWNSDPARSIESNTQRHPAPRGRSKLDHGAGKRGHGR